MEIFPWLKERQSIVNPPRGPGCFTWWAGPWILSEFTSHLWWQRCANTTVRATEMEVSDLATKRTDLDSENFVHQRVEGVTLKPSLLTGVKWQSTHCPWESTANLYWRPLPHEWKLILTLGVKTWDFYPTYKLITGLATVASVLAEVTRFLSQQ